MIELIAGVIVDFLIVILSIFLIKKIKPNKANLLNLAFGTFWMGVAGIYFFAGLADLSGLFNSVYLSKLFFMLSVSLAAVPVVALALFLSATSLKKKSIWILPLIFSFTGIIYVYFISTVSLIGPLIGWTVKYYLISGEALALIQYSGYSAFTMVVLLALIACKSRKQSTFIQFNSVALSMGLFFLGGYLDLLGNAELQTILLRGLIVIGALIGYIGFSPNLKLIKLLHKLT